MNDDDLLACLDEAALAVAESLAAITDWGDAGTRPGQYLSDIAADRAAVEVLSSAGLGVFSEESGWTHRERPLSVVVDPLDGSTNASRSLSWWAASLCAVDAEGPRVALVVDLRSGTRVTAVRGRGTHVEGRPVESSGCADIGEAIVGLNGLPAHHLGWAQCRALGAAALDLCAVASGHLDGYLDCSPEGLAPWDYLGGALACREAGATVLALDGRRLHDLEPPFRRGLVAASTPELAESLAERFGRAGPITRIG